MTLREEIASTHRAIVLNTGELAEAVAYLAAGSEEDPVSIAAVVNRQPSVFQFDADGSGSAFDATVSISSAAEGGIAAPAVGDKLTFDSTDWFVRELRATMQGSMWELRVVRRDPRETSRETFRIRRGMR